MGFDKETVTSSQNKYVSLVRSLTNKKIREKEKLFRFDGVKLMCEAIKKGVEIDFMLVSESEWASVLDKAYELYGIDGKSINCPVIPAAEHIFAKLSEEMAPEGVICVAKYASNMHGEIDENELCVADKSEKILLLESVRDPQNVGAIVRVAAAFGVDRIVISSDCADIYNSKTIRASMGTVFGMRIDRVKDIALATACLRRAGRRVFAAALDRDAKKLGRFDIELGDCVIIGNEGHGLSDRAIAACDGSVYIPMAEQVESLNAATAAAVLVWEFFGSSLPEKEDSV